MGQLLISLSFDQQADKGQLKDRVEVRKSETQGYLLMCHIISGYEIGTNLEDEFIQTHVSIEVYGDKSREAFTTDQKDGNFPLYNYA